MILRTTTPGRVEYRDPTTGLASIASYPDIESSALALVGSGELSAILAGALTVECDPLGIWDDPDGSGPRAPALNALDDTARRALADEARVIIDRESEPLTLGETIPAIVDTDPPRIGGRLPFGSHMGARS